jgi:hypothetical protein
VVERIRIAELWGCFEGIIRECIITLPAMLISPCLSFAPIIARSTLGFRHAQIIIVP